MRLPPAETEALRAAVVAFCARNGNAERLALALDCDSTVLSKLRSGKRGISYDNAVSLAAVLSRLPYVPTDDEPSARRSPSPQEREAIAARVAKARLAHSVHWIAKRGGVRKYIVYSALSRPEAIGRDSYDKLNTALDLLGVARVEVAPPPAIVLPDLSRYEPIPAADASEIRAQLSARCDHRGLPKLIVARGRINYARLYAILDGGTIYAHEASSLREALDAIPARPLDEDTCALRTATVRRIEAFRTRRGRGSNNELARVSGISQQRISAVMNGRLSFGRGSLGILNRALDALESQTTSTTGATR